MKEFVFGTNAQFIAMKRNLDAHPGQMSRYSGIQLAEGYSPSPCCLDVARLEDGVYAFRFTPAVTGPADMPPAVADILAGGFTGSFLQVRNTLQHTLAPLAGVSPEETLVDPSEAERDERNRRIHGISDEELTEEERERARQNQGRRRESDPVAPPRLPSERDMSGRLRRSSEQDMSRPPRPFGDEHSSNPRNDEAHGMGSDEPVDAPTRPAGPQISGMPEDLPEEEGFRPADMARLRKAMGRKVVGHEAQMDRICRLVANHTGKVNPQRPLTIFMAGGPGTGKTLTAESLQEALAEQGLPYGLVRVNLSEYKDAISSNRMVGAAAGYVGYGDGLAFDPLLSEERQVVLLDEAEKAHSNVQDMLLQIMDKGQLQLASPRQGKSLVDFKRAILIFTSNVPVDESRLQGDGADEALRRMLAEA
ncbi:MAG: ATP-dependent Clp protease ATP-binding subunit, partial [Oscillospiraceae bacterium]|nr:ATP-dependent Clp protease ATP-binding subunit [Oscillospiraceae bacterium]